MNNITFRGNACGRLLEWKNELVPIAISLIALFTAAEALALNARAYVQSGLIGQLDAIANNGVNSETGEDIHGAPTLWADIAGNASMQKTKSQFTYAYGADYVTVGSGGSLGGVYFKSQAFVNAVKDRSLTLQMLVRETSLYAGSSFVSVTGGLGIGDTSSVVPAQPFRSFMYRGKTDVLPFSTAKYLNRDVLLTVVIGSGGRIAFHQTNPSATDFSAFTGAVNAGGGYVTQRDATRYSGPAGTIYYQAYGETVTSATLVIDNKNVNNNVSGMERYVEITPLGEAFGIDRIGNLVMRNSAHVAISNRTIKVYGDIIANEGSPRLQPYTGDLVLCGKGASLVASSCTFDSLTCMEPGKRIAFGTG